LRNRTTLARPVHLNELDWTCSRGPGGAIEQIGFVSYFRLCPFLLRSLLEPHARASAILVDERDRTEPLDARSSHIYIVDTPERIMKVEFLKWGNSLALRVPKAFAQEIGARVGKAANMEVRDAKF